MQLGNSLAAYSESKLILNNVYIKRLFQTISLKKNSKYFPGYIPILGLWTFFDIGKPLAFLYHHSQVIGKSSSKGETVLGLELL